MLLKACILEMRGLVKVVQLLHRSTYVIPKTSKDFQRLCKWDWRSTYQKVPHIHSAFSQPFFKEEVSNFAWWLLMVWQLQNEEKTLIAKPEVAPSLPVPPSKWRLFNNSVIFRPICFKFRKKVDCRTGNDVATPPQRYSAVRGAAAPFPAAPPSKWRPFNNSVIFQPICFKFG